MAFPGSAIHPHDLDGLPPSLFPGYSERRPAAGGALSGYVNALATDGTAIYAGTDGGFFCLHSSSGSWGKVNTGLSVLKVTSCLVTGGTLFVGTAGGGAWKRALTELSVGPSSDEVPAQFSLSQNYPNPFNPGTTIKFGLPGASRVNLSVFDILGREVSALVNERKDAGVYEVTFDGSGLASGVYFYRIQAGSFVQTRKLLLLLIPSWLRYRRAPASPVGVLCYYAFP